MSGKRRRYGVRLTIYSCIPGTPTVLDWLEMHGPDGTLLVFETEEQAGATLRALGSLPDATFRAVPLDAWVGETAAGPK